MAAGGKRPGFVRLLAAAAVAWAAAGSWAAGADPWPAAPGASDDAPLASRYVDLALEAAGEGRWAEAESVLDRAADFSDVSSDASYLAALAKFRLGRPMGAVLDALARARAAARWERFGDAAAALLEARALIAVRAFDEALAVLAPLPDGPEKAWTRAAAAAAAGDSAAFRSAAAAAMDAHPRDPGPVELAFEFYARRLPSDRDRLLIEECLRRLPFLVDSSPRLGFLCAPFVRDPESRKLYVAAYRAAAGDAADPGSLPAALDAGLVDGGAAALQAAAAFRARSLSVDLAVAVWDRLRDGSEREAFLELLAALPGSLFSDADGDGRAEGLADYSNGAVARYRYDADQDGIPELDVDFLDELPVRACAAFSAEPDAGSSSGLPARPRSESERSWARAEWERYPFVLRVSTDDGIYSAAPAAFPFSPVETRPLFRAAGRDPFLLPRADPNFPRLTPRSLVSFCSGLERPGKLASGSVEKIAFSKGIPLSAVETLEGVPLSILSYRDGRPSERRMDLDLDGRMETTVRYRRTDRDPRSSYPLGALPVAETIERDADGDGRIDYRETVRSDGSSEKTWLEAIR